MRKTHFYMVPALTLAAWAFALPAHAQLSRVATTLAYSADERISYFDARRAAYDNGYREGLKEGEKDARRGDRFDFRDEGAFRDGDRGYRRQFGDRDRYRQAFRSGFSDGYSEAYRRLNVRNNRGWNGPYRGNSGYGRPGYGGYGRPGYGGYGYYSPAFDNGAQDGYEKGVEDARKNRSFDPLRHKWYRDAERHYRGEYGARDFYRDAYRRGFQQGYERGYREGRYRW
jgi:flagellar biosynthesis/type III secretory pathway protein FliH